ncbi:MAG: MFS transporter [Roseburia sp.]|nr:MFS transporter [Roseburia sp.]MCM1099444.1 MFS transporter [Ruminococcus flavefaciens]
MGKTKELGLDANGVQKVMRGRDYGADLLGQLGLALMSNIVGQLTYFYTDKVGVAAGAVGVVMAIAKVIDAFTDVICGHIVDNSGGGDKKYYRWMIRMAIPAAAIMILLFTVPIQAGQIPALAYVLVTNVLLTAILYTMIATPFAAIQIVRSKSMEERTKIGVFRAVGSYAAGMLVVLMTVPITNALGGTQSAWIKYGVLLGLVVLLCFLVCYNNGRRAKMQNSAGASEEAQDSEEEKVPFLEAMGMLFRNRYWIMVLLFNLIVSVTSTISGSSATYYCKWIFGNDNLVAAAGAFGMLGTVVGFLISQPMIKKFGAQKSILIGLAGSALFAGVRCLVPSSFVMYAVTGALGSCIQIPLMCLYGVILGYAVDYNEYKYDKKVVAISSGAVSFGSKVGSGVGSIILAACLALSAYDATLEVATDSMRAGIYAFSNYVPIVINVLMFVIFLKFDIEKKLPQIKKEMEERRALKKG